MIDETTEQPCQRYFSSQNVSLDNSRHCLRQSFTYLGITHNHLLSVAPVKRMRRKTLCFLYPRDNRSATSEKSRCRLGRPSLTLRSLIKCHLNKLRALRSSHKTNRNFLSRDKKCPIGQLFSNAFASA